MLYNNNELLNIMMNTVVCFENGEMGKMVFVLMAGSQNRKQILTFRIEWHMWTI